MRQGKSPYSLHKRPANKAEVVKKKANKKYRYVYYVQFRDEEGNYTSALSTGQTSKGAAEAWSQEYLSKGQVPTYRGVTFSQFAVPWWKQESCPYIKSKARTGHELSPKYIQGSRRNLDLHILPYFGNMKMTAIKYKNIRDWMFYLSDVKELNPATVNRVLATMKVMCKEAVRLGYMKTNPSVDVGIFKETPKAKSILTMEEVRKLFAADSIDSVWGGNLKHYALNLLAASTGMRQGEILGLYWKNVYEGYLEVKQSWSPVGGLKDCKNHEERLVPIPVRTRNVIQDLRGESEFTEDNDFVFLGRSRYEPDDSSTVLGFLYRALSKIGIGEEDRENRNVTFHSWRHFFNTMSRKNSVPDSITRRVLGHKTPMMTETYTQLQLQDLEAIQRLQENLFAAI